jgi:hypothetical protein
MNRRSDRKEIEQYYDYSLIINLQLTFIQRSHLYMPKYFT